MYLFFDCVFCVDLLVCVFLVRVSLMCVVLVCVCVCVCVLRVYCWCVCVLLCMFANVCEYFFSVCVRVMVYILVNNL